MSIQQLMKIIPPPQNPIINGPPSRRQEVEASLGTPLPDDYWELAAHYGSGSFIQEETDEYVLRNPFYDGYVAAIMSEMRSLEEREFLGKYKAFPKPRGLLKITSNENPTTIFYLTGGPPEKWKIVAQGRDPHNAFEFKMSLTAFLAELFRGEKAIRPWPKGWFRQAPLYFKTFEISPAPVVPAEPFFSIYQLYIENGNQAGFWATAPDYLSEQLYHVLRVAGKESGPIPGSPPNYGDGGATVDVYESDGTKTETGELENFAGYVAFRKLSSPPWASADATKK